MNYQSQSAKQTQKFAKFIAEEIIKTKFKGNRAVVLALKGNLGSGKTTFAQGFLKGLGVKKKITSPTFVIQKNYILHTTYYKKAYHIDCYRIKKSQELLILGIKEIFDNPQNIVLIEWPERILRILPKEKITINFKYGKKENERKIVIG